MTKRPRTNADLLRLLAEQLRFLEDSSLAFDAGKEGEAKRLAATLRILLHDGRTSFSLLKQVGRDGTPFVDSAQPERQGNLFPHLGLVALRAGPDSGTYFAPLDDRPFAFRQVPFPQWWTAVVFRTPDGTIFTRRDLILTAADQDGGAHVDPALDERYARLVHDNALGLVYSDEANQTPLEGAERAAIRQIAHEVLRTLIPNYRVRKVAGSS